MEKPSIVRLQALAAIWDRLAADHSEPTFDTEFREDLDRLERFQSAFPKESPVRMIKTLERKIIRMLRKRFAEEAIQRLRSMLNRSN